MTDLKQNIVVPLWRKKSLSKQISYGLSSLAFGFSIFNPYIGLPLAVLFGYAPIRDMFAVARAEAGLKAFDAAYASFENDYVTDHAKARAFNKLSSQQREAFLKERAHALYERQRQRQIIALNADYRQAFRPLTWVAATTLTSVLSLGAFMLGQTPDANFVKAQKAALHAMSATCDDGTFCDSNVTLPERFSMSAHLFIAPDPETGASDLSLQKGWQKDPSVSTQERQATVLFNGRYERQRLDWLLRPYRDKTIFVRNAALPVRLRPNRETGLLEIVPR